MLILFDIDGTLLLTRRAGIRAMIDAGQSLFGPSFHMEGIDFNGRIDPWIWQEAARINALEAHEANHSRFRAAYAQRLEAILERERSATLLPGVQAIVQRLAGRDDVHLGLLTGNYPETGRLKIRKAGLDPDLFQTCAWGCDGRTRRDLPPIARQRFAERHRREMPFERTVIIGDTPHDVDCAQAHGCRSLAVATGIFDIAALEACRPDHAVADLSRTDEIERWLLRNESAMMPAQA